MFTVTTFVFIARVRLIKQQLLIIMPKKTKKGKKSSRSKSDSPTVKIDPLIPDDVPPPPRPMESLMKLLTRHPVDERELFGIKVSTRALKNLSPAEIKDLRVVFEAMDIHGRGYIGAVEVRRAMKALGFKVTRDQARQMVKEASCKQFGFIDFNEFLDLIIQHQGDAKDVYDEIMQGFKLLDVENRGVLTLDNLKQASVETGCKFTTEELMDMLEEADLNGDGFIDKEEFTKVMLQTNLF